MENNVVKLNFKENLTMLAGYEYGAQVYSQQATSLDFSKKFTVVFPDTVIGVASSFIQGFFAYAKKSVGLNVLKSNINIKSRSEELSDKIIGKLYLHGD